ncbi:MAG: hypothetical protein JW782_07420 [Candidatus Saganbacteria bacterium]|nr:hypothetical protein [Candidatus Saganbacteria bacterium]
MARLAQAGNSGLGQLKGSTIKLFQLLIERAPFMSRSHLADHSGRMLNNLSALECVAGDQRVLLPAVILHDIGVFFSQEHCHGPISAQIIRPHLADLRLTKAEQDRVCSAVRAHDDTTHVDHSLEASALRALDDLDAFGAIGVYRFLEIYQRRGFGPYEIFAMAADSLKQRLNRLPEHYFNEEQRSLIDEAWGFAHGFMRRMQDTGHGPTGQGALLFRTMSAADWSLFKLAGGISDRRIDSFPLLKGFFQRLSTEILEQPARG